MNEKYYQKLVEKMNEVSTLAPQTVGPFTPLYRLIIPVFKRSTWQPLLVGSVLATILLYIALGASIVWITSILQHGF